jgi:hypothetical protein
MKMFEASKASLSLALVFLYISLAGCSSQRALDGCEFSSTPTEELLRGRVQQLEIVDAETGEIVTYDAQGNPVFEGGQPLALWAVFNAPTTLGICILENAGREHALHHSVVTFSNEITMQPLGTYDLGSYQLYLSMDDVLVASIEFTVR